MLIVWTRMISIVNQNRLNFLYYNEYSSATHNRSSNSKCTNIHWSYSCSYNPGYFKDGKTCSDISERTSTSHKCLT